MNEAPVHMEDIVSAAKKWVGGAVVPLIPLFPFRFAESLYDFINTIIPALSVSSLSHSLTADD